MKGTIAASVVLGAITGFFYRDELNLPTNMRIKVALLEYNLLSRRKLDTDILDIVDPTTSKEISKKTKEIIEAHENEVD